MFAQSLVFIDDRPDHRSGVMKDHKGAVPAVIEEAKTRFAKIFGFDLVEAAGKGNIFITIHMINFILYISFLNQKGGTYYLSNKLQAETTIAPSDGTSSFSRQNFVVVDQFDMRSDVPKIRSQTTNTATCRGQ
jgi:hypothetical protein